MRYLLDINVLLALGHTGHSEHSKAAAWYTGIASSATGLHTCAITELGFVRVATHVGLQTDIASARSALDALKSSSHVRFELVTDDLGAANLPTFVKTLATVTDGHLLELAKKNSMKLVTLDRGIPGATFIG